MRKLIALAVLGFALSGFGGVVLFGCAPVEKAPPVQKSLLKCSTCGLEFTDPDGLKQHQKDSGHHSH